MKNFLRWCSLPFVVFISYLIVYVAFFFLLPYTKGIQNIPVNLETDFSLAYLVGWIYIYIRFFVAHFVATLGVMNFAPKNKNIVGVIYALFLIFYYFGYGFYINIRYSVPNEVNISLVFSGLISLGFIVFAITLYQIFTNKKENRDVIFEVVEKGNKIIFSTLLFLGGIVGFLAHWQMVTKYILDIPILTFIISIFTIELCFITEPLYIVLYLLKNNLVFNIFFMCLVPILVFLFVVFYAFFVQFTIFLFKRRDE